MMNESTQKRHIPGQAGFTIIETMMAVFVLSVAIAGSLALASKGLDVVVVARQEVSAAYLVQDAIEYIRATRDSNCLASSNPSGCSSGEWLGSLPAKCGSGGCIINTINGNTLSCPLGGVCLPLNYNVADSVYTYVPTDGSTILPTIFTRSIYIQTPVGGNSDEASTSVVVSWPGSGGITHVVRLHEDFYNWQ